jgi:hypothetical protein
MRQVEGDSINLADDEQQAVCTRCAALGLSLAHAQRLAAATNHTDPQALLWVLGLDFGTLAPIQLVVMAVEQAAQQSDMPINAIWGNVERIAGMWSLRQTIWMVD